MTDIEQAVKDLKYDESGLIPAIVQDAESKQVLMMAYMNAESLLATMDPLARERADVADPLLAQFLLWGGLFIATVNGQLDERELANIRSVVGDDMVKRALDNGGTDPSHCRDRFLAARMERRSPLSALELHRIFTGLSTVAAADGVIDEPEIAALRDLAGACGVSDSFVDVALQKAA